MDKHPQAFASREDLDSINRRAWAQPSTVRLYERLQGWTDPGECAAVAYVSDAARGQPILDIGAGAGRTSEFLLPISDRYVAIDYTDGMVRAFRKLHPQVRMEQMDARDLSAFFDEQFALVVFSFNGIDAVDREGRTKVLREVHRVLRPGGRFLFSAHNHEGPGRGESPKVHIPFTWNPIKLGWRSVKAIGALPRSWTNHHRNRQLNESHDGWSIMNAGAHDFGIVVMYTALAEQKRQLREAGFECEVVFDSKRGQPVADGADTRDVFWFHYVARKI
ncbi:MAG TPA: class I SAM-dependent methyltransferase [Ramlibacter sp.]|nr:class I SAM-dependent methyltransferase [Ramlibacter sp.]